MFQLRSTRSHSKKLSASFKRIVGSADDGAVPEEKKNPSIPVIVRLRVNNKPMNAMVDTGSATSIIHIHALNSLAHQPHIQHRTNIHRAANNTELRTIGIVKLKINIGNIPTFVFAEISTDLCTELVLGNDWIRANGIDIITTEQCIRKRQGPISASTPIIEFDQQSYPVFLIQRFRILPEQQMLVPIRTDIQNADMVIFTPSENFVRKNRLFIPHALLKIENGFSWITIMNATEYPRYLNTNMMIGTISIPTPTGAVTTRAMNHKQRQQQPTTSTATSATTRTDRQSSSLVKINDIVAFTVEELRQAQTQDTTIRKIVQNIEKKSLKHEYCIKHGIGCRMVKRFHGLLPVPIVLKSKTRDILLAYHNTSMNGTHFGKDRTYYKIRDRYYWPNMYNDIAQHVKACRTCSVNKHSRRKPDGHLKSIPPLDEYLETTTQMAKENIEHRQRQSKKWHDASRRDQVYSIGDFVFVKRLGMNEKFAPKYDGPYQIIGKIKDLVYRVQNPNDLNDIMRIHVNRTRQCHSIPSNN